MAKLNIKPLFDNVLVKPLQAEETLPSGIILPDSAKEKPHTGVFLFFQFSSWICAYFFAIAAPHVSKNERKIA